MSSIFFLDDGDESGDPGRLNLDDLYERSKQKALAIADLYGRVLRRIHTRIKMTARQSSDQHIWYVVPEVVMGAPQYKVGDCTAYIINKLRDDNLAVRYTHPNLLLISWAHWVPAHVRTEVKKQTGIAMDGQGNRIIKTDKAEDPNAALFGGPKAKAKPNTKDIKSYQPSGRFVYDTGLLERIADKSR